MGSLKKLNVNPCKMCMPIGAAIVFKGIEGSMLMMHGSQGCSTYIRSHMSTHYDEPVDIASSSIDEKGTVYGGEENLKKGLINLIKLYSPQVIGIITTCLAETIGEDINRIVYEFKEEYSLNDISLITVSTPGYGGSQFEGYYLSLRKIVEQTTVEINSTSNNKVNIIAGNLTPAEIRRIKEIVSLFELEYTILPDISETLASPYTENYKKIPLGGTSIEGIKNMGTAVATIEMGALVSEDISPGAYLRDNFNVPLYSLPLPIGLKNSDRFINLLSRISNRQIPECLIKERGRLIDGMIDSHKYNAEGRAAVFGDPELVFAVSSLCQENGITPVVMATGSSCGELKFLGNALVDDRETENLIIDDTDFEELRKYVSKYDINLLIGNSDGSFIEEKDGFPLVRIGFPVHDRVGASRQVAIGYEGSIDFLDKLTNCFLEQKHSSYREDLYQMYY